MISSQWLTEMVNPLETNIEKFQNMSYGYLWWILDAEKSTYAAIGNSGNVLYIDPESETVIAITAYFKPTVFDRIDFIETELKPFLLH